MLKTKHDLGASRGTAGRISASFRALEPKSLSRVAFAGAVTAAMLVAPSAAFADPQPADSVTKDQSVALPGLDFVEEINETVSDTVTDTIPEGEFSALLYGDMPAMTIDFPETGLSGLLTVDHVEQTPLFSNVKPSSGVVGDAKLNWQLSDSFALSTTFGRRLADSQELSALGIFEDKVSGGFTYYVSPRFHMMAEGTLAAPDLVKQSFSDLPSDAEASVGAIYQFLPYFSGRVNYTYDMKNPLLEPEGERRNPESTVSFTLIGKF